MSEAHLSRVIRAARAHSSSGEALQDFEMLLDAFRDQLADAEKLSAAERAVVEAALEWHKGVGMTADYKPIFTANDRLDAACGALLDLRAKEAT